MKRAGCLLSLVTLAAACGCVSTGTDDPGPYRGGDQKIGYVTGSAKAPPHVPGLQGPYGQPVAMAAPYTSSPPGSLAEARSMMAASMPLNHVQQAGYNVPSLPNGMMAPNNALSPPGVPFMPGMPAPKNLPPTALAQAQRPVNNGILQTAGPMSMPPAPGLPMGAPVPPGAVASVGALTGHGPNPFPAARTEVYFTGPLGMRISWYAPGQGGKNGFSPDYIEAPARYNFLQAAIYRLKLTDIPNRPGVELYPTLEVVPSNHRTNAFLAHSAVPLTITEEDLEQVASGNYVVKVIYLPDPQYQDLATTGPDEVVSSRLEPGVDPIQEACRRGSILLVLRMGNIQLELPHSPAMDAPNPFAPPPHPPMMPGMPPGVALPPGTGLPTGAGAPPGAAMFQPGMMPPPGAAMMPPPGMMVPGMPNGGAPLVPGMQPPGRGVPTTPIMLPATPPPSGPTGKLPEKSDIQPTQFNRPATTATLAGQTGAPRPNFGN